ncbi:hypothetical protein M8J76_003176 [Diaphorina citri]|nr:hypothetical protein M8J76_003176 [Diaphorina citri]
MLNIHCTPYSSRSSARRYITKPNNHVFAEIITSKIREYHLENQMAIPREYNSRQQSPGFHPGVAVCSLTPEDKLLDCPPHGMNHVWHVWSRQVQVTCHRSGMLPDPARPVR